MVTKDISEAGGFDRFAQASGDQRAAGQRAHAYLTRYLPVSDREFIQALEQQHFRCFDAGSDTTCVYTRARPPAPCISAIRVSIEVSFSNQRGDGAEINATDIDVAALVTPDWDYVDMRGCLPL